MRVIVAGSRDVTDRFIVHAAIAESGLRITELVSGCARGVDRLGEDWARDNAIPIKRFPADWKKHGRAAGPIRNMQMAEYAEAAIIVCHTNSRGSESMIECARKKNLPSYIKVI